MSDSARSGLASSYAFPGQQAGQAGLLNTPQSAEPDGSLTAALKEIEGLAYRSLVRIQTLRRRIRGVDQAPNPGGHPPAAPEKPALLDYGTIAIKHLDVLQSVLQEMETLI